LPKARLRLANVKPNYKVIRPPCGDKLKRT
jgi:hypothetical protein